MILKEIQTIKISIVWREKLSLRVRKKRKKGCKRRFYFKTAFSLIWGEIAVMEKKLF